MELYILSKQDLSILSICKLADYQINLDEETNAKSTFTLMKTNGLKKENYMVLNGLYRQFIFVIDDVQTEKESDVVTVTALDISNVFNRKVIEKNINTMKSKSIEEFLANTISENFVNSDDTALNVNYIEIYWHTNTQGNVATNAENGLYNFHTFLTNCRQYKNIYTDFKLENLGNPQTVEGKRINVEAKNRKIVDISLYGESTQATRSGKNLFDKDNANIINTYIVGSGNGVLPSDGGTENKCVYIPCKQNTTYTIQKMIGKRFGVAYTYETPAQGVMAYNKTVDNNVASITITTDSSAKYLVVYLRNGNASGEITLQQALDSLQIEKGSTATDYEQYGAMPSPDYRSEIENLEGKNLVQQMNWKQVPSITTGATVTTVNGYGTDFIEIDNTKNYIFSYSGIAGSKYVAYYDESKKFLGYGTNLQIDSYAKWNVTKYVRLRIDCSENAVTNLQLEAGTVATPYAPYNSLGFKDEGKNLFNIDTIIENLYINPQNGDRGNSSVTNTSGYIPINANEKYVITYDYTSLLSESARAICFFDKNKNYVNGKTYSVTSKKVDVSSDFDGYVVFSYDKNCTDIMFSKEEQSIQYEPYKQQTEYFPLSEGQKLYKGSYLADDGTHHKRKQVVLDGTETWILEGVNAYIKMSDARGTINSIVISNQFKYEVNASVWGQIRFGKTNNNLIFYDVITEKGSLAGFKAYLAEQYANGTPVIVEYELAEEEIVPYTTAQQEAWNKIKNITLFEGVNHISSDANMVLKYYPLEPVGLKFVLRIDIENKQETTKLIDTTLPEVTDYNKVYEEDVTAKVTAYIRENNTEYNLYLKTDRTTTTNKNDPDRASGKIEVISVDTVENAPEEALNVMKGNNYKHLVEFKIAKTSKLMDITKLHIRKTYQNKNR